MSYKLSKESYFRKRMSGIAQGRLKEERKNWRRDHPFGFWARPVTKADGSSDLMKWEAGIPGKEGTDWEGGVYTVSMEFSEGESVSQAVSQSNVGCLARFASSL